MQVHATCVILFVAGVYTFGSPHAGNANFAQQYDGWFRDITIRFVHRHNTPEDSWTDIVANLPSVGVEPVGRYREVVYSETNKGQFMFIEETEELPPDISDNDGGDVSYRHKSAPYAIHMCEALMAAPSLGAKEKCVIKAVLPAKPQPPK